MVLRPVLFGLFGLATAGMFAGGWLLARQFATTPQPVAAVGPVDPAEQSPEQTPARPVAEADPTYKDKVLPFLQKYCFDCHKGEKAKGGLALDGYVDEAKARKDRKNWLAIQHVIASGEMPPPASKKPQPTKDEKEFILEWVANSLTKVDCTLGKDPGRVTIRRLNRAEYNNTVRDLCGVDFKPAEDFPSDDVGYGFDNIGDVLSVQPILIEKYFAAAEKVLNTALAPPEPVKSSKQTFRPQNILVTPREAKTKDPAVKIVFRSEGMAFLEKFNFPAEGEYTIRFRGWGTKAGDAFPKATIRVGDKDLESFTVEAEPGKARVYETTARLPAGEKRVAVAFTNGFEDKDAKKARELSIELIEIEGPAKVAAPPDTEAMKLLLVAKPAPGVTDRAAAEQVLTNFARRAYRRPVKPDEVARLLKLFDLATKQGEKFADALKLPMKAVLVSPHFLYRIEEDPKNPNDVRTIGEFEFATRLSYFLWSSMPDEELFALAGKGTLRKPEVLEAQVKRMLKDPKARALSENFAGQWLQLRNLKTLAPDKGFFPNWDDKLREIG
ncbi:MAG: DUF1592 domain-containing protein, partial [Gemmataceae bacterium]|nr:DUF1592 domain-containing protein [Gemmataceae bacterium]